MDVSNIASAQVKIVQASEVSDCRYIDEVKGSSGYGKSMDWKHATEYSAMSKAEELGANDIVLEHFQSITSMSGTVTVKAYSCHA